MKTKYYTFLDGDSGNICGTVTLNDENKSTFFERCKKKCLEMHFDEYVNLTESDLMLSVSIYESQGFKAELATEQDVFVCETWIY